MKYKCNDCFKESKYVLIFCDDKQEELFSWCGDCKRKRDNNGFAKGIMKLLEK